MPPESPEMATVWVPAVLYMCVWRPPLAVTVSVVPSPQSMMAVPPDTTDMMNLIS